jgi:hypothetical protein
MLPAGHEVRQLPAEQMRPAAQVAPELLPTPTLVQLPAAPQCWRLVRGSAQVPAQSTRSLWHETWQEPLLQT